MIGVPMCTIETVMFLLALPAFVSTASSIPNCFVETLVPEVTCTACSDGYSTSDSALYCQPCVSLANCKRCSDASLCNECDTGFNEVSGSCQACPNKCVSCITTNSLLECLSCDYRYYVNILSPSSDCLYCPFPCSQCYGSPLNGLATCSSCEPGYSLVNGTCAVQATECSGNCSSCISSIECSQCDTGYGLFEGNCKACQSALASSCNISANGTHTTEKCISGYGLLEADICTACPAHCLSCYYGVCNSCTMAYFLKSDEGLCYSCPDGCDLCYFDSASGLPVCTYCSEGYYPVTDSYQYESEYSGYTYYAEYSSSNEQAVTCRECQANCSYCVDFVVCVMCQNSFYLDFQDNCSVCPSNCEQCFDNGVVSECSYCNDGYYLDSSTLCIACPLHCSICAYADNSSTCLNCSSGYRLDPLKICLACPTNCEECEYNTTSAETDCYQCRSGYATDNYGTCKECPTDCFYCEPDSSNDMQCLSCISAYGFDRGCSACPPACTTCTTTTLGMSCLQCQEGYVAQIYQLTYCYACYLLMPGCVTCGVNSLGQLICYQCQTGYTLLTDGSACLSCASITNCLSCVHQTRCQTCDEGYVLYEESCIRGCYSCSGAAGVGSYGSYQQCGLSSSNASYDLVPCMNGSCWVSVRLETNETTYSRMCKTERCTETYAYRVCTKTVGSSRIECSRCCNEGGCNGFTLTVLDIKGTGAALTRSGYVISFLLLCVANINNPCSS